MEQVGDLKLEDRKWQPQAALLLLKSIFQKLNYVECEKGGFHIGELVNYACTESKCKIKKNSIGCSVCMEQEHANCRKSPLKYLYKQLYDIIDSQKNASSSNSSSSSSSFSAGGVNVLSGGDLASELSSSFGESSYQRMQQDLLNLIVSSRQQILEDVLQSTNKLIEKTRNIQKVCVTIFDNIEEQTRQKINTSNQMESLLQKILYSTKTLGNLQSVVEQLFDIIPEECIISISQGAYVPPTGSGATSSSATTVPASTTAGGSVVGVSSIIAQSTISNSTVNSYNTTGTTHNTNKMSGNGFTTDYSSHDLQNLHDNLSNLFKQISSTISQKNDVILQQLNHQEKYLNELQNDQMLIQNLSGRKKLELIFSPSEKHGSISIISPNIVKSNSGSSSNYKFALTTSGLPMTTITKFAFKMKSINSQNWIAIGVALKNVIKSKNYSFGLSLGHGAYMISSNSGSWSHSEQGNNNVVKSFDFGSNSIVECKFDPSEGFIHFGLKDNPAKSYKLAIQKQKDDDTYHPCVLFYYPNDEVELIHPYQ